jgi:hypothetical protein
VAGKSGISQARTRLGWEPVRQLHDEVVRQIADPATKGAWYAGLRLVRLDASTLDGADAVVNEAAFGRPGASRGNSADPQLRLVSLVENGTHVLFGSQLAPSEVGEVTPAQSVLARLPQGMLGLADRLVDAVMHSGPRPGRAGPMCSGVSRRTCAWPVTGAWPMALISAASIPANATGATQRTA